MLEQFKDNKQLVRMSPFMVATVMGKADGIFLEEEKVIELSHFEDFSLNAEEFTTAGDLFLDLENEDFDNIWELDVDEILSTLKELPIASRIVLGTDSYLLAEMLERVALQIARSDGEVHDLEISVAAELEYIFETMKHDSQIVKETSFDNSEYEIFDIEDQDIEEAINEHNNSDDEYF